VGGYWKHGKEGRLSQEDLAQFLGTKGLTIGRYERDEMKPSIEVAAKMADYLVGKADIELDPKTLSRILKVSRFSEQDREHMFFVIDAFIANRKIQSITQ
jgi:DNA-binding XRE family transcriptional regulator